MNRRKAIIFSSLGIAAAVPFLRTTEADTENSDGEARLSEPSSETSMTKDKKLLQLSPHPEVIEPFELDPVDWKMRLNEIEYHVLREEGTERPFTSPLNDEKREGEFACAGCNLVLTKSEYKYDSKTGWPSFWEMIEGRIETKTDFKLVLPRTEYHCARCGGHQGHVFKDGPKPTGLRYCNNGVAMKFIPA